MRTTLLSRPAQRVGVVLVLIVGWLAAAPTPGADAWCNGVNGASVYSLFSGGDLVGQERVQYASTCDGDEIYKGRVLDAKTDGSCVNVEYFETTTITAGVACTTGSWSNYTYWDQSGSSGAWMRLCVTYACGVWVWTHGY